MLCVCAQNSKATENLLAMEYLLWPDPSAGTLDRITVTWKQGGLNNALERCPASLFCFFPVFLAFWFLSASSSLVSVILVSMLSFWHLTVLSSTEIGVWGWVLCNIPISSSYMSRNFECSRHESIEWQIFDHWVAALDKINALNWSLIRFGSCFACRLQLVTRWFYQQQQWWQCQRRQNKFSSSAGFPPAQGWSHMWGAEEHPVCLCCSWAYVAVSEHQKMTPTAVPPPETLSAMLQGSHLGVLPCQEAVVIFSLL